jgi:hypothetical protein
MQASAACHQRYKDLKSLVTDKIANCDQSVSLHEEYNKHIERMTDLVSMSCKISLSLTLLHNKLECFKSAFQNLLVANVQSRLLV